MAHQLGDFRHQWGKNGLVYKEKIKMIIIIDIF